MQRKLVNVGCGPVRPDGWINTDKSLGAFIGSRVRPKVEQSSANRRDQGQVKYLNLNRRWPWKDNSIDVVYLSHVLEHLDSRTRRRTLSEAYRVLKHKGVFRVVVPDLYQLSLNYISAFKNGEEAAASELLYWLNLHSENVYLPNRNIFRKAYDFLQYYPHLHRMMFDIHTLSETLIEYPWKIQAGLEFGSSGLIPEILQVEGGCEVCPSIYVECCK